MRLTFEVLVICRKGVLESFGPIVIVYGRRGHCVTGHSTRHVRREGVGGRGRAPTRRMKGDPAEWRS